MDKNISLNLEPYDSGAESTLLSWNGTTPESPDAKRLVYFRQPDPVDENMRDFTGEIWVCDWDLTNHRKVFDMTMTCTGFEQDGPKLETLGGPGNHIDASPDRQWFVKDTSYHQKPITIRLYRRG